MFQAIYKAIMRVLFPDLVKEMEEEGVFNMDVAEVGGALEEADYMRVEDNGADVTIFAFSGLDVLFAGHSRYHFMGVIQRLARKFGGANFVFLRDCQRFGFFLKPDGSPGGAEFYSGVVGEAMERLGASHNVAVGSSAGATAAQYMAYKNGFQQVIAFSALFDTGPYLSPTGLLKTFFNFPGLIRDPRGYFEILLITAVVSWIHLRLKSCDGEQEIPDVRGIYAALEKRPAVTMLYGEYAPPDKAQAMLMSEFPEVKLMPVPTGRHNIPGYLYKEKTLGKIIAGEISAVLEAKAKAAASIPPEIQGDSRATTAG